MNWQLVGKSIVGASLAFGAAVAFGQPFPNNPPVTDGTATSQENFNYGVCSTFGSDTSCYHNWSVPRFTSAACPNGKVLLYTRTAGPRHASLGTALVAGLGSSQVQPGPVPLGNNNNTQKDIIRLMNAEGICTDYTETVTNLSGLNQYSAVVFFSNSRDTLFDHGRAVNPALAVSTTTTAYLDQAKVLLRQYMRAGGGFVAVHNAHGTEYNWPWYEGLLGNSNYYDHGNAQNGDMVVVGEDPSTAPLGSLGAHVPFHDEWYNLVPYPTNVKFLVTVDETTLATKRSVHPGFPSFHPVAWCHYYDGGRAWITTLGHFADSTSDTSVPNTSSPGRAQYQGMLVNGIKSAMGLIPFCT